MKLIGFIGILFYLFCFFSANAQNDLWQTIYEKSGYTETPRYPETIQYVLDLADNSDIVNYKSIGTSPQGREIPLLIVDKSGHTKIENIRNENRAIILIQAGIHAGESDGKDAGLLLIRDMVIHKKFLQLLDDVSLLFVPIFNVDGHENFGPYNRINQNGPKEMGMRVTAQRLNLNRDFLKAESPEMQAMIQLYQTWLPDFYIDCHVTDGADYLYPLTYGLQMHGNLNYNQSHWLQDIYLPYVEVGMKESGNPIAPYMDFVQWHNPKSGIRAYMETPRYSGGYAAINNRPALLIETHMLKDYKTRVTATYEMLLNSMKIIAQESEKLRAINLEADQKVAGLASSNSPYILSFKVDEKSDTFTYEGYAFSVEKSDLSGGDWYKYSDTPSTFEIDYYNWKPDIEIELPHAYIIPVEFDEIIGKLKLHNVHYKSIESDTTIEVETYQFRDVQWKKRPFEGRVMLDYELDVIQRKMHYSKGSKIVYLNQRATQLAVHMLEPMAPDSFVRWGFMNRIFEQKEYAESYVMEKMAREMLANNPQLKAEFEEKKRNDNDFDSSSNAILNWFYQKSPYWDHDIGVYPIGRIKKNK